MCARVPWRHTLFLAREGEPETAARDLARPGRVAWPQEPETLEFARAEVRDALPRRLHPLVDLSVAGSLLLEPSPRAPGFPPFPVAERLLGRPWARARAGRWASAPVPVIRHGRGAVVYCLVGALPGAPAAPVPSWAKRVMGPEAVGEVGEAFGAARFTAGRMADLVAVPVLAPGGGVLREHSLGLPLALAALAALGGRRFPGGVAATGNVDPAGGVRAVPAGGLEPKARAVRESGCRLFLYPGAAGPPPAVPGLESVGVAGLEQAWRWARLYPAGRVGDLRCLGAALEEPACLAARCGRLSAEELAWCRDQGLLARVARRAAGRPEVVRELVRRLEACLEAEPPHLERAAVLAGVLGGDECLEAVGRVSPAAAFAWCSARSAVATALERWGEAQQWADRAEEFGHGARRADPDAWPRFLARRVLAVRGPGPVPGPLPRGVARCLARRRAVQRLRGGVDPVLGELLEALGRHAARRGARHAAAALWYFDAAARAFGNGRVPEWKAAWRRLQGWRALALLDLGDPEAARQAACAHLGGESWWSVLARRSALERHVTVRCLAEGCGLPGRVPVLDPLAHLLERPGPAVPPRHLWLYNAGRVFLAERRADLAWHAWRSSVLVCRRFAEPPASVLLPLAGLAALQPLEAGDLALARHAAGRLGVSPSGGLGPLFHTLRISPSSLFPFDAR